MRYQRKTFDFSRNLSEENIKFYAQAELLRKKSFRFMHL